MLGWGVTFPDVCFSPCRRVLRGERALWPLRSGGVQERRHLCQPAHRGLQVRVPPGRVRAALLRDDHQELPPSVLHHLQGAAAALPLHCVPHVSPGGRVLWLTASGLSLGWFVTFWYHQTPTLEGHCRHFWQWFHMHVIWKHLIFCPAVDVSELLTHNLPCCNTGRRDTRTTLATHQQPSATEVAG